MINSSLARRYVELMRTVDVHRPGFVDGYYGPDDWRPNEVRSVEALQADTSSLLDEVQDLDDPARRHFLKAQLGAAATTLRLLSGEPLSFAEEVQGLYQLEVSRVPESHFDKVLATLYELLPGKGDLAERELALRDALVIPPKRVEEVATEILTVLRQRTLERFPLPDGEEVELRFVKDQPWGGYNWYLGDYRSRVEINLDLPLRLHDLPDLLAHEAYPGHHTELVTKEQLLCHEGGRLEHSVLLLNGPETVVREGVAMRALQAVMGEDELLDWLNHDLLRLAGLEAQREKVELVLEAALLKRGLAWARGNAALMLLAEGADPKEVEAYLRRYALLPGDAAAKMVQNLTWELGRGYAFTYLQGAALVDDYLSRGEAQERFTALLAEPLTPELIRTRTKS